MPRKSKEKAEINEIKDEEKVTKKKASKTSVKQEKIVEKKSSAKVKKSAKEESNSSTKTVKSSKKATSAKKKADANEELAASKTVKSSKKTTSTKKKTDVKEEPAASKTVKSSKKTTSNKKKTDVKEEPASSKRATKKVTKKETKTDEVTLASEEKPKSKKSAKSSDSKKKADLKKATAKSTKKATTQKTKTKQESKKIEVLEYYDLPYRYNQTTVKILAQTPTTLFVYWDISDADRQNFINTYGEKFFEETKPVLRIYNETNNYSFEVDINDFANSWYLHISDSKCTYNIELGRRPIAINTPTIKPIANDYIYITSSNELESPNGHILFDELGDTIYFRNVKTNIVKGKKITSISFMKKMNKIYNIYDMYKKMYPNENIDYLNNPTSGAF